LWILPCRRDRKKQRRRIRTALPPEAEPLTGAEPTAPSALLWERLKRIRILSARISRGRRNLPAPKTGTAMERKMTRTVPADRTARTRTLSKENIPGSLWTTWIFDEQDIFIDAKIRSSDKSDDLILGLYPAAFKRRDMYQREKQEPDLSCSIFRKN
jgi:hypothetical protein